MIPVPTFRLLRQPIKAPQGDIVLLIAFIGLSEVLWSYKRRTRRCKRCYAPIKLADLRIDASLKALQGVHHITGGEPCVMLLHPQQ